MTRAMHPVEIADALGRYLFLLLIPLLRGLWHALLAPGGLTEWLSGAWMDAATILIMLTASVLRWRSRVFRLSPDMLWLREGVLLRRERSIPISAVTCVSFRQNLLLRALSAVKIRIFTEAKPLFGADATLSLSVSQAHELFGTAGLLPGALRKSGRAETAWFSLFASNALTGAVFLLSLLRSAERLVGARLQQRVLEGLAGAAAPLTFLPLIFAAAALVVLAGWAAAFLQRMAEYHGFVARRRGGALVISHGLFAGRASVLPVRAINCVDRRQSLLSLFAGLSTVFLRCAGYGSGGRRRSVLFLAVRLPRLEDAVAQILPGFCAQRITLAPVPRSLPRYAAAPFALTALAVAVCLRAGRRFPGAASSVALTGGVVICALLARLFIAVAGRNRAGVGADANRVTLCYPQGFLLHTVTVPRERIAQIEFRRSFFQRRRGLCDVAVWVKGMRAAPLSVKNLGFDAARATLVQ